jgi:hypothetical protein
METGRHMRRICTARPLYLTGEGSGSQYQTNESSSEALVLFRDTALATASAGLVTACAERSLLDQASCDGPW